MIGRRTEAAPRPLRGTGWKDVGPCPLDHLPREVQALFQRNTLGRGCRQISCPSAHIEETGSAEMPAKRI